MVRPTYTTATIGQPIDDPRLTPYGPLHKAAGHFLVVRARKQAGVLRNGHIKRNADVIRQQFTAETTHYRQRCRCRGHANKAKTSYVGFWHKADNRTAPAFVRFWTKADKIKKA
jgi:hypothetical protein